MAEFVDVAKLEDLPSGAGRTASVGGKEVALFNVKGVIYAINDACLHQGSSLGSSNLTGKIVTCRAHGWRYDVTTGNTLNVPDYGVASYPVKIVDGRILIAVS